MLIQSEQYPLSRYLVFLIKKRLLQDACGRFLWILDTIKKPVRTEVQSDGRIRKWKFIEEVGRYLRVILLADGETVHNAFFDRNFKEEGK